jgi:hypothetical protein
MYTPAVKSCCAITSEEASSASTPVLLFVYDASSVNVYYLIVTLLIPTPLNPSLIPFLPSSSEKKSKYNSAVDPANVIHCVSQSAVFADEVLRAYKCVKSILVVLTRPSELKNTFHG